MEKKLRPILYSVGVSQCYTGYHYFITAVSMAAEDYSRLSGICKEIYQPIATRYNTNITNVERDIRTIRDIIMKNGGDKLLEELTGCKFRHNNPMYPKEIIEIFAEYLNQE